MHTVICTKVKLIVEKTLNLYMNCKLIIKLHLTTDLKLVRKKGVKYLDAYILFN